MVDVQTRVDRIARAAGEILSAQPAEALLLSALDAVVRLGGAVMATPKLFHQKYRDRHGATKATRTWYANVTSGGKTRPVALGPDKAAAQRKLREILGDVARGMRLGPLRLADILAYVEDDYRAQGYKSIRNLNRRVVILKRVLGNPDVLEVDAALWTRYQRVRLDEGAKPGTIELERAAVIRGLTLARRYKRTSARPELPHLTVRNARKGFLERPEFDAINAQADPDWRAFHLVCYLTGWRPWTEIRSRQWQHVDFGPLPWTCKCGIAHPKEASCSTCRKFRPGWLRLEPGETKNGDGRDFPLMPELRAVLEAQRARCDALQQRLGIIVPWVFFGPAGQPLFIGAKKWRQARAKVGLPTKLLYDCRRTRARNFERAGVPRSSGKKLMGHRTDLMYYRYGIVDAQMLVEAGELADTFEETLQNQPVKVSVLSSRAAK